MPQKKISKECSLIHYISMLAILEPNFQTLLDKNQLDKKPIRQLAFRRIPIGQFHFL